MIAHIPDRFKTQEMCRTVEGKLYMLKHIPDRFKTQEMCNAVIERYLYMLKHVPENLKTQEMCDREVEDDPSMIEYIPDWFVTQDICKRVGFESELLDDYRQRKAEKVRIKNELLPLTWHPDRYWDWCMPEDEKQEISNLWE